LKIAVECKSPLLQKSLELFLEKYLCSNRHCDIIIRDEQCFEDEKCFYISSSESADLVKPFSKSQLILALETRYQEKVKMNSSTDKECKIDEPLNFDILQKRIEFLTQEYQQNIIKAVKAFYEK